MPNQGTRGRVPVVGRGGGAAFNDDAGAPAAVTTAGAAGTSPNTARHDHAHAHGTGYLPDAHHAQSHALNGTAHTQARAAKSADYTAAASDFILDFDTGSSTDKTLTLPAASGGAGPFVVRLVAGTKDLLLARTGSDTVNGTTGANLGHAVPTAAVVRSDGISAWYVEALYRGLTFVAAHLSTSSAVHFFDTTTLNSDTTLTSNAHAVYQVDASGGAVTITLPTITGTNIGEWVVLEKADATNNTVTVAPGGSDTIEGLSAFVLRAQRDRVLLYSGTFWPTVTDMWHVLVKRTGRAIVAAKTGAYTVTDADDFVPGDATGGAFTVTLPTAVGRAGREFVFAKVDASGNAVTLDGAGSETINGATTLALSSQWATKTLISTGSEWLAR